MIYQDIRPRNKIVTYGIKILNKFDKGSNTEVRDVTFLINY